MTTRKLILYGILAAIGVVILFSPISSRFPDGLEKLLAFDKSVQKKELKGNFNAIMPDYSMPGIKNRTVSLILSGVIGTILTLGAGMGMGFMIKIKRKT